MTLRGKTGPPVAASVTPLPLEADSRTYRIARALAEFGYRSIVVEGRTSRTRFWDEAIEVRSLAPPRPAGNGGPALRGGGLRNGRFGRTGEIALYAAYRGHDWWRHRIRPLAVLPKADLYYLHSFEFRRAAAMRAPGAPIIYDAHDFYRGIKPPHRQPSFDRNRLRPFLDALEDRLITKAAAVVTVSEGVAGLIEAACGRRPAVIRNCHDERLDDPRAPDLRTMLSLAPSDRLCVVAGNCKPGMAVEAAVEAFTRLPEHFHLAFLGRGYDSDSGRFRGSPAAGRIHFGHCVAPDQVVPAIRSADLGLVIYEPYSDNYRFALPNGFFQVVAAGLPVVRGALPEIEALIAGRAVGICLERLDGAGLAAAIEHCAENLASLRSATAALAAELRWESEAQQLRRVIEAATAAAGRVHKAAPTGEAVV